jgi:hypothetical protein
MKTLHFVWVLLSGLALGSITTLEVVRQSTPEQPETIACNLPEQPRMICDCTVGGKVEEPVVDDTDRFFEPGEIE